MFFSVLKAVGEKYVLYQTAYNIQRIFYTMLMKLLGFNFGLSFLNVMQKKKEIECINN